MKTTTPEITVDQQRRSFLKLSGLLGLGVAERSGLIGSTLRPRSIAYKTVIARELRERVWPLIESGEVRPVIHTVFPAAQAAQAHALMESSVHVGKIVLDWNKA